MFSTSDADGVERGEGEGGSTGDREAVQEALREAADRPAAENPGGPPAQTNRSSSDQHSSPSLSPPGDGDEPRRQRTAPGEESPLRAPPRGKERHGQTVGVPSASPPSPPVGFSGESERDEAVSSMPWWAGAFGAAPEMRDSPEARGCYARRFCEIFFPDNTAGATEVRRGWPF